MPTLHRLTRSSIVLVLGAALAACARTARTAPISAADAALLAAVDSVQLLDDLSRLSADSMRGRRAGSPESVKARRYIVERFTSVGLAPVPVGAAATHLQPFSYRGRDSVRAGGMNVMGLVRGTATPDRYIVVTAHYDHVGVRQPVGGDSIYNGADDNASGTAALMALARHFQANPARHSILFVALDAEEQGLRGARAFVATPPVPRASIVLNVNMDMVSLSAKGELYAAGAGKYPQLRAPLERVVARAPVTLILGHDMPMPTAQDDWTLQSDQGAFHEAGIPFVYFGVEDHPHYHQPSDELRNTTTGFFVRAVRTVLDAVRELDAPR